MLQQFLELIKNGSVQTQFELADKMHISPDMVLQMARDLTTRGYLQGSVDECNPAQPACTGCPMGSACQSSIRSWGLTEKGERILDRQK